MKIKVYTYKVVEQIDDDFEKVREYFKSKNYPITLEVESTEVSKEEAHIKLIAPNEGKYDAVMYVYDKKFNNMIYFGLAFLATPKIIGIYQVVDKVHDNIGYIWKSMAHEIMHAIFYSLRIKGIYLNDPMDTYIKNDDPSAPDGNFAAAWKTLEPHLTPYKYFKPSEVQGLKPELVRRLDQAREIAGIPFVINSGYRTAGHNTEVGGVEDSSHTKGEAGDIRAMNSTEHFLITKGLIQAGFTRISRKYPNHIHADIDKTKPQNVLF